MVCPLAQTVPRVGRSPCAWGGSVTLTFAAGDSHQLQGAEVLPQDCESPPGTLSGAAEGKVGLWVAASPLGWVLRSSHALIQPMYCKSQLCLSPPASHSWCSCLGRNLGMLLPLSPGRGLTKGGGAGVQLSLNIWALHICLEERGTFI